MNCTVLLAFLMSFFIKKDNLKIENQRQNVSTLFSFLIVIVLSLLSGLRSSIGDTGYYLYSYKYIMPNITDVTLLKDWGFAFIQKFLLYFNVSPQVYLFIISFITIYFIVFTLKKYTVSFPASLFLFICSGIYVSTMNGMRQYLVAAIVFAGTSLIIKNKKISYFILILVLSTLHSSVLVMIPIYFIVRRKAWSKSILVLIATFIMGFVLFNKLFSFFTIVLNNTQYGEYIDTFGSEAYAGVNTFRILVAFVPVLLSFLLKNKFYNNKWNLYDLLTNFSILNFLMILLGFYNWIFARMAIYFDLYNLILIPFLIWKLNKKDRTILLFIMSICYILFLKKELDPYIYTSYYLDVNKDFIGPLTKIIYE